MTPERLHKSYRIATQNQKWLPYGYTKSKMATIWIPKIKNGYQIATLLGSHLGAKREPNGSQMVAIFKIASYLLSAKILCVFVTDLHFLL